MSREGDYLVFAAEQYRFARGLSGRDLADLFAKYDVWRYIIDMFEQFHIECEANMIAAVDEYIARQGGTPPAGARNDSRQPTEERATIRLSTSRSLFAAGANHFPTCPNHNA